MPARRAKKTAAKPRTPPRPRTNPEEAAGAQAAPKPRADLDAAPSLGDMLEQKWQEELAVRADAPDSESAASLAWVELENEDPRLFYVWVGKDADARAKYEMLGYVAVPAVEGGVRCRAGHADPETGFIVNKDTILYAIHKAKKQLIEREGIGGAGGQVRADHIDKQLKGKADLPAPVEGRGGVHFSFSDISAEA
jgi:hypothetical protein